MNENGPGPLDKASGTVSIAIMTEHAAKINLAVVRPALDLWIRMQYSHQFEDEIASSTSNRKLLRLEFARVIVRGNRDGVASRIRVDGKFYEITGTLVGFDVVCNAEVFDIIYGSVGAEVFVQLINALDRRSSFEVGENIGQTAFAIAVVHNGDSWLNGLQDDGVVATVETVVRDLVNIDFAKQIVRTNELHFLIPSQIAAIEKAKLAKINQHHNAIGVIGTVAVLLFACSAMFCVGGVARLWFDEMLSSANAFHA